MKNPFDVLRMKEREIQRVKVEIESLRMTARLLSDEVSPAVVAQKPEASAKDFNALESAALAAIDGRDFQALESVLDAINGRLDQIQPGSNK
jgi:hypothetical protein